MRYLIAILLGLLAAGCGNKAVDNLMSQASMLIEEHPDSALLALRQIDPSAISPAADARAAPGCSRRPTPAQVPEADKIR